MNRGVLPILGCVLCCAVLFAGSVAHAQLTFSADASSASGRPITALLPGDVVTIDITLRADFNQMFFISGSAINYDRSVVAFRSAQATETVLNRACIVAIGCFDGFENRVAPTPVESLANPLGPEIRFFDSDVRIGESYSGELDFGVSGLVGDPQFRLVFEIIGAGTTTLDIGTNFFDYEVFCAGAGDACFGATNLFTSVTLLAVPEPGPAMLLGLGLFGLTRREPAPANR